MYQVSVEKTSTLQLPDLIDSVIHGEEVVFTQNDLPIAKLVAVRQAKIRPQFGSAKGLFEMAEDFNEPISELWCRLPACKSSGGLFENPVRPAEKSRQDACTTTAPL